MIEEHRTMEDHMGHMGVIYIVPFIAVDFMIKVTGISQNLKQ